MAELDLWEVSIVTFPMLPAARVEQVNQQSSDARLVAAIRRGTMIAANRTKLFDPNQPRDDHGRWTSGGEVASKQSDCTDSCLHLLEKPKRWPGDDKNTMDFKKCYNNCMALS